MRDRSAFDEDEDDVVGDVDDEQDGPFQPPAGLPIYTAFSDAMEATPIGGVMAVAVRVTGLNYVEDMPLSRPGYYHAIHFQDVERNRPFRPRPTCDPALVKTAEQLLVRGGVAVVYGRFVVEARSSGKRPPTNGKNRLQILHLRPITSPAELLAGAVDQRHEARQLLHTLRQRPGGLFDFACQELADIHHVATDHLTPRFLRMVHLVLLQAASDGNVSRGQNPRLSLYFLSEPGQGKGILSRYALSLAPRSATVQPPVISVPGLAVRMEQRRGQGWTSIPGALPRSHGGACVIQDLHRLPAREIKNYHPVLMSVCEEGIFTPTKVSDAPYQAQCALHINGNHLHVVQGRSAPSGPQARLCDIGTPLDLFSRVDIVASLCVGEDIEKVAIDLARQQLDDASPAWQAERDGREQRLRLLFAELRQDIPDVDLTQVEEHIADTMNQIQNIVREYAAKARDQAAILPAALSLRMGRTLRKLIAASARLDGRAAANAADVACAAEMLSLKLEVIKWVCGDMPAIVPQGALARQARRAEATCELRRHRILEQCGGQGPMTLAEIARRTGEGERILARDLRQMAVQEELGRYTVPTPLQQEQRREAAEQRGETLEPAPLREVADNDEDALVRTQPHKFYDSLPRLPVAVRPFVRRLPALAQNDNLSRMAQEMLRFALERDRDEEMDVILPGVFGLTADAMAEIGMPVPAESLDAATAMLREAEWERRAGLVLALYSADLSISSRDFELTAALRRGDLPLGVRRHIESALARRGYLQAQRRLGREIQVLL